MFLVRIGQCFCPMKRFPRFHWLADKSPHNFIHEPGGNLLMRKGDVFSMLEEFKKSN